MSGLYNKMYGRDFIISSDMSELNASVILGETTGLDSELNFRIIRKNKMGGKARILKMVPESIELTGDIQDTYVREELPFMSFKDSNVIKSGILNNEEFFGMIRFDELDKSLLSTGPQFLTLKLAVTPVDGNMGDIRLHELDSKFDDYNVSFVSHPNVAEEICVMSYDSFKNEYVADITAYAKQIISGNISHNGFTFTSDGIVNICSSEAYYGQPRLILEYIDPNKFQSENEIPAEIEFLETSALLVELDLSEPYPILKSELIFSQDAIAGRVIFAEFICLDSEVTLIPTVRELGADSELLFSKEAINSEVKLNMSELLLSEVSYRPPTETDMDAEINFGLSSYRPAVVNLAFPGKTILDSELKCYTWETGFVDSEVTLKNQLGTPLDAIVSLYTNIDLDAEVEIMFVDIEDSLLAELEFTKTMLPSTVRFTPSTTINSEFNLIFSKSIDAEVTYVLFEHMDAEVKLYTDIDIDAEMNLALADKSNLDADITFNNSTRIDAEVKLYTNSILNSVVNLALVGATDIEAELVYENSVKLDAELIVFSQLPLNSEFKLLFDKKVDAEVKLYTTNIMDAEVKLYTETYINSIMHLHLVGMSSMESEVIIFASNTLDAEVEIVKPGEEYLDACVTTFANNSIDAEMVLRFIEEIELDAEVKLYVNTSLDSEVTFKQEIDSYVDAVVKFNILADNRIDAECEFVKHVRAKILIISN